ncbi:MAG: enoyl-CoA hydratase-related protein [Sphingobacteriia bacterium]|nr:enoyl-CoA hydratase-related protein [Sphingobacteriia bacterium]
MLIERKDLDGGITMLTINRPEALNALNADVFKELNQHLDELERESGLRALIVTGAGKAFVAGADIAAMRGMSVSQGEEFGKIGQKTFARIAALHVPVVAAINGFALGGGLELALSCDIRFGSERAKMGMPEVSLGLIPGFGGTQRLPRLIGKGNAMMLLCSGMMVDANEAYQLGLLQKVVASEQLIETAVDYCNKIVGMGPNAVSTVKKVVNLSADLSLADGLELEAQVFGSLFTPENQSAEGMTAFLEKRKPNWNL